MNSPEVRTTSVAITGSPDTDRTDAERKAALGRLKERRQLVEHVVSYAAINAFLWVLWFITDDSRSGTPWPVWVSLGWGVGLVLNIWAVLGRKPITEADIEREMLRGRRT